jgi:ABC-2 type transport system ATP-binding protein
MDGDAEPAFAPLDEAELAAVEGSDDQVARARLVPAATEPAGDRLEAAEEGRDEPPPPQAAAAGLEAAAAGLEAAEAEEAAAAGDGAPVDEPEGEGSPAVTPAATEPAPDAAATPEGPPVVQASGLRAAREGCALDGVDLRVGPGLTAVLGRPGAGKRLLCEVLLGLAPRIAGELSVLQADPARDPLGVRRSVGYVPGDPGFYPHMSPEALGRFLRGLYPRWDERAYHDRLARLGVPVRRPSGDLPAALVARLALAVALAHDPGLLVVEEGGGLDALGREDLLLGLEEERDAALPTLLTSSRPAEVLGLADRVVVLAGGQVVASGTPEELAASTRRVEVAGELPSLPPGSRGFGWRPGAGDRPGRLWVHGDASALEGVAGVAAVHTVDPTEAALALMRSASPA